MTPAEHAQRIRQLEFMLEKADYGMGMPRDYQRVLELRVALEQARKDAVPCVVCGQTEPDADFTCCTEAGK